jgi:hypothetical protein
MCVFAAYISALGKISLTCGPASVLLTTEALSSITTALTTDFQTTATVATYTSEDNENSKGIVEVPQPKAVSSSDGMNSTLFKS